MNRDELNEIYKKLENQMHMIIALFTPLHKGLCHIEIDLNKV